MSDFDIAQKYRELSRDISEMKSKTSAGLAALVVSGKALDEAMMKVVGAGEIDLIKDAELVDRMHRALNDVAAVIGTPWRAG